MQIQSLQPNKIVYVISDQVIIRNPQDMLDLIGETEFQDLVMHDYNFAPGFFDLSTKLLGDVFLKLTNYRVRLAIIGDFESYPSKVLPAFIYESNKQKDYIFVASLEEVKTIWELKL